MRVLRGFESLTTTQHVFEALESRRHRGIGGLWGGSTALLTLALHRRWSGGILLLTADDDESFALESDIAALTPRGYEGSAPLTLTTELYDLDGQVDRMSRSQRIRALAALADNPHFLLLTSLDALTQPAPGRNSLQRSQIRLRAGTPQNQGELFQKARAAGLRRVPLVSAPGEISQRGDVIDIFPMACPEAWRLEFFDGELESIRTFDPATQSSLGTCDEIHFALGGDDEQCEVLDHVLHKDLLILNHEPLRIEERMVQSMSPGDATSKTFQRFRDSTAGLAAFDLSSLPTHDLDFKILSAGSKVGSGETDPLGRLRSIRGISGPVRIVCQTGEEKDRLQRIFAKNGISDEHEQISLTVGSLSQGFRIADLNLTILSNTEFAGVPARARRVEKSAVPSRALSSFFELGPGDIVVHAVNGIARFEGIELVERGDSREDHLSLLFRDDVRLLVPASKIHLVQKYVGSGDARPRLDKLGGKSFARRKEAVAQSLFDMAADLLDLQAARAASERPPYPSDPLETEFLDQFPFSDTPDQTRAWTEIRGDLEGRQPMDRLLCGDVGFGKTEVAMRAAFRVAITGRQVAVLVPTTILAEQHCVTFSGRFESHGLVVDVLSRFRSPKERRAVLEATAVGRVDVLVGTHRLLSEDVRFRDLGLIIIDEEQRFGVRHKEHLKELRRDVDVLTLSATPIPRTLHAALVGIRNISTLDEAPPGRQEVDTRMTFKDPLIVKQALHRELQRNGQVFYVHNRVETIERAAAQIRELAPDAKVVVGHGQMTELQVEKALRTFLRGEADILVCTTIIENGLDIPRANTMLIERSDRFGLAELHQLRGRVGRSSARAHCLLMLDRATPISPAAKKRLKAIEEFSSLGAGFAIAMKDLEIRGAGNMLGPEQSGHIAAVGYEMYCRLLDAAATSAREDAPPPPVVREVDVDLGLQAFIPDNFLADSKARLELLREMDGAHDPATAETIGKSIADRFGALPEPVQNLLLVFLLKHQLVDHGVRGVQFVERERLVVRHAETEPLGGAWLDRFAAVRPVEPGKTHLLLPAPRGRRVVFTGRDILGLLLDSLLGAAGWSMITESWSNTHPVKPADHSAR